MTTDRAEDGPPDTGKRRASQAQRFFELSLDLLCTATDDFRFDNLSPSWKTTLGWSFEELRAKPFLEFCHPDDVKPTLEIADKMLNEGLDAIHFENRYRHKDGHYVWLSWVGTVRDGTFFAVARDVTSYKQQEEIIQAANAELKQFAYAASHDLQEPLRTISGLIQLADAKKMIPPEGAEAFSYIRESAERMQAMVDGLLEYSHLEVRARQHVQVPLGRVVELVAPAFPELQVQAASLPSITCERSQIERLFQNLLSNANRYRHPDRRPTLDIAGSSEGGSVELQFRDNGVGIRPGQEDKALQIFRRCHARSAFQEGHGIGLALCKRIAERHGGGISLHNNDPGPGITVVVKLGVRDDS